MTEVWMQVINSRNNDLIDRVATNIRSAQDSGQKRPAQSYPSIPRAGRIRLDKNNPQSSGRQEKEWALALVRPRITI